MNDFPFKISSVSNKRTDDSKEVLKIGNIKEEAFNFQDVFRIIGAFVRDAGPFEFVVPVEHSHNAFGDDPQSLVNGSVLRFLSNIIII